MLIGIAGKAGAGKDTVANCLNANFGFKIAPMAYFMKQAVKIMFGLSDAQLHDPVQKEIVDERWGMTPRRIMQIMGSDAPKPFFGEDIWVRRWEIEHGAAAKHRHFVIPDVRYPNEAKMIRSLGGKIVRVIRAEAAKLGDQEQQHSSEQGLPVVFIDQDLLNIGTIQDLHARASNLTNNLMLAQSL